MAYCEKGRKGKAAPVAAGDAPIIGRAVARLDRFDARYYRNTMPTISFKVSGREAARIRELARREGMTVSEFLRRRAISTPASIAAGEYRIAKDSVTGLPVMEAPPGTDPVSSDQIRALMADFP